MKRWTYTLAAALTASLVLDLLAGAGVRFDQKLSTDKQIVHVLNRMTFGPKPGDVEQVRRMGVDKWVDLQLHPERIAENPELETKLQSLKTLQLATWQILEEYPAVPAFLSARTPAQVAMQSLPPQTIARLNNCTVDERVSLLASFPPDQRHLILAAASPQMLDGLPDDIRQEATQARQAEQDARQKENRRLMPPLNELLSPEQIRIVNSGTPLARRVLINSFSGQKHEQLLRALPPNSLTPVPDLQREALALRQAQQFVNSELIENKLDRAIYSNRQLEEVLVDFWMNHFNIYNGKGADRVLLTSFERDAIRPNVFGHFKDLLLATARHPAMLFYLDNWLSQVQREDIPMPQGVHRPGLNENYGREVMELHTLGVDGGYTQDDVTAVARAFTGWTIYDPGKFAEFQFNPAVHDRKEKVILGHTLPAMGAESDGLQVIDILAHHPSTAKFISKELAQRFVADNPPQALVDRMADTFTKTDGDLRAVMQTMFTSPEFLSEGAWHSKLKSPLEMVVSAVRALNADVTDTAALAQRIADLGEPLYGKVEPTGYPNTGESWANTAGILGRINFASALTADQVTGVTVDMGPFNYKTPAAVAAEILHMRPPSSMLSAIERGIQGKPTTPPTIVSLIISSPEFQRR